jgi:hypothetical protein
MKHTGKKITASSLLTILGVVCFGTVLVAAALITSGFINLGSTNVTSPGSVVITPGTPTAAAYTGDPTTYPFSANVPDDLTSTVLTIRISETSGVLLTDVTSVYVVYAGGSSTQVTNLALVGSGVTAYVEGTYSVGSQATNANVPVTITIIYAATGSYTVLAQLEGNGAA